MFHPRHTPLHAGTPVTRRTRRQRRQEREADPPVLGEHRRPVDARVLVPPMVTRRPLVLVPGIRGRYISIDVNDHIFVSNNNVILKKRVIICHDA